MELAVDPPSIKDLPDEVLAASLAQLTLSERHQACPRVCRRWRQLLNSAPQLLRSLSMTFKADSWEQLPDKLSAFFAWLLAHAARHVQQLDLTADLHPLQPPPRGASEQLAAAVSAVCSAAGALRRLRLDLQLAGMQHPAFWAARLRHLTLRSRSELTWQAWPQALPALQQLSLGSSHLELPPSAFLPPSLTSLHLDGHAGTSLPPQVTALTRLESISLEWADYPSSGFSRLTRLPALRRLALRDCSHLPACLPQLTRLEQLAISDPSGALEIIQEGGQDPGSILAAALPQLRRLTYLALDSTPAPAGGGLVGGLVGPPAQLASLPSLQTFYWLDSEGEPLPPGAWLSSLRQLYAPPAVVADSPALAGASRLECLALNCFDAEAATVARALRAAAALPALRRLLVGDSEAGIGLKVQHLIDAAQRNPAVHIQYCASSSQEFAVSCGYNRGSATSREAFFDSE